MKNQEKIFKEFKNNFSKQNKQKKNQLKELFLSGKYDIDIKDKKNNDANKNNNMNNKEKEKIERLCEKGRNAFKGKKITRNEPKLYRLRKI